MSVVTSSVSCIMQRPLLALAEEGNLSLEAERRVRDRGTGTEIETETKGEMGGRIKTYCFCLFVCFELFHFILFHFVLFISFVLFHLFFV